MIDKFTIIADVTIAGMSPPEARTALEAAIDWKAARIAVMALSVNDPEYKASFAALADAEAALSAALAEQLSPEEQSLREAIGLGVGGRGVAEY